MQTQIIILSLPEETLRKVKLLAVQRGTSVSNLLAAELEKLVIQEEAYARAQQQHLQRLEQAADLGMGRRVRVDRDELHER